MNPALMTVKRNFRNTLMRQITLRKILVNVYNVAKQMRRFYFFFKVTIKNK